MKLFIAHASGYDFATELYEPLKASSLAAHHELLFPQDGPVEEITKEMIAEGDVLVAEISRPSLGVGIEIGWANAAGKPVIALERTDAIVSFSVDNAVTKRIEYDNTADMVTKLEEALAAL